MTLFSLPWIAFLLAPLGAVGFLLALYFVLVTYGYARPDSRWLPQVCRMDEATCARIIHLPEARVLGPPNALFGLGYYAALVAVGLNPGLLGQPLVLGALLLAGLAAAAMSVYLAWALLRRLRVVCVLCFAAHGINWLALAVLLLIAAGQTGTF